MCSLGGHVTYLKSNLVQCCEVVFFLNELNYSKFSELFSAEKLAFDLRRRFKFQ